jgi:hypothetical protein
MSYAQTKRGDDRPWCGDDAYALGLGATGAYAMLGAISVAHHGSAIFWAYCEAEVGYLPYIVPT